MRWTTLLRTGAAAGATAAAGALATDPDSRWYQKLDLPSWQPPPAVFPLVWTPLYVSVAGASAKALGELHADPLRTQELASYQRALGLNLVLNAGWSWLFWRGRRPWLSAAECGVLAASSADLARRTAAVDRTAGAALVPYAAWCAFATVLSTAIARRNPRG